MVGAGLLVGLAVIDGVEVTTTGAIGAGVVGMVILGSGVLVGG